MKSPISGKMIAHRLPSRSRSRNFVIERHDDAFERQRQAEQEQHEGDLTAAYPEVAKGETCQRGDADVSGLNRQFAMTTVDKDAKLHTAWPSMIKERIERGPDGAAGIEHVVAYDDVAALDVKSDGARCYHRANARRRQVVTIKLNIQNAGVDWTFFNDGNQFAEASGQRNSSTFDADER